MKTKIRLQSCTVSAKKGCSQQVKFFTIMDPYFGYLSIQDDVIMIINRAATFSPFSVFYNVFLS